MAFGDEYGSGGARRNQQNPQNIVEQYKGKILKVAKLVGLGLVLLILATGSCYTVDQTERAVVTRFGAAVRVAGPGAHIKLPLIESVTDLSVATEALEWGFYRHEDGKTQDTRMESYSRDQQPAHLSIKVTFHAKPDEKSIIDLFSQFRTVEGASEKVLQPNVYEAVKSVFGHYNAAEVIQGRDRFNTDVDSALRKFIPADAPISLESIKVQDIKFDPAYEQAISQRMQAEVEVTKVAQNVEREKKQAEIAVVQAQAEAAANLAKAEAQAKATKLAGEAEATAIRARAAALASNPSLVQLTLAEKWNGVLPTTVAPNGTVPFLPLAK